MLKIKGLSHYTLTKVSDELAGMTAETFAESLLTAAFSPCLLHQRARMGFAPLVPDTEVYTLPVAGGFMFCVEREEKILPADVVKREVTRRKKAMSIPPTRNESKVIKDDVESLLLGRAFSRYSRVYGWLSPKSASLVIFTGAMTKAEKIASCLRRALGSLPTIPAYTNNSLPLCSILSSWVLGETGTVPDAFCRPEGSKIVLEDLEGRGAARFEKTDLSGEMLAELMNGRVVRSVGMSLDNFADFTLHTTGGITGLRFDVPPASYEHSEDPVTRFDADAHLLIDCVVKLLDQLNFEAKQNH